MRRRTEWFLDASYAIAVASRTDASHTKARELAERVFREGISLVTTRAVLLEIGNSLASAKMRAFGVNMLVRLSRDPNVTVVEMDEPLYAAGFELYRSRPDKEWGMIDCISFVVMERLGIKEALTADHHFEQAGFRALLR